MGWLGRVLLELFYLALGDNSSWAPHNNFRESIDAALGRELKSLGFNPEGRLGYRAENSDMHHTYLHPRFRIEFIWDRQELHVALIPLDIDALPADPTLPPMAIGSALHSPPYSLWDVFVFLGVIEAPSGFRLRTPGRYRKALEDIRTHLPKLSAFVEGDLEIYTPFRRYLEIQQLGYSWDKRRSYSDTEALEKSVPQKCRHYAELWWAEEDYVSVADVLAIIESQLTSDEQKRLKTARRKSKKARRAFRKMVASI